MRKVSRTSTETRRPSWVGTSLTGTSNGISRVVTRCETAIHGGMTWLPGPIVRSMRPRRSRIAFEPSGTGTMNERNTPRNTRRTPTASRPPRRTSVTSRISPTTASDDAGDKERVPDAVRRRRQQDDRQTACRVRHAERLGRLVERHARLGQLDVRRRSFGGGVSEGGGGTACSVITSPRRRHRSIDGRHVRWRRRPPAGARRGGPRDGIPWQHAGGPRRLRQPPVEVAHGVDRH